MSKPVSNDEVEDVLSSIRRLVSDDKRPLQHTKPKPANTRLVLTPALRVAEHELVAERDEMAFDLGDGAADQPEDVASSEAVAESIPESWLDEEDHADYADEAFWEDDEEDDQDNRETAQVDEIEETARVDEIDVAELLEAVAEEDVVGAEGDGDEAGGFEETQAETDGYDVSDAADDAEQGWPEEAVEIADEARSEDEDAAGTEALYARLSDEVEQEKATELSAKITALETAVGAIRQDWEPDDSEEDAFAGAGGDTLRWEDDVELDAHGKPIRATAPEIDDAAFDPVEDDSAEDLVETAPTENKPRENGRLHLRLTEEDRVEEGPAPAPETAGSGPELVGLGTGFAADDAVLDEEALRDLVSDIVRSELQGALGERITRNVRKLVRREIHRALTAQELD